MRWLDGISDAVDIECRLWNMVRDRQVWHAAVHKRARQG